MMAVSSITRTMGVVDEESFGFLGSRSCGLAPLPFSLKPASSRRLECLDPDGHRQIFSLLALNTSLVQSYLVPSRVRPRSKVKVSNSDDFGHRDFVEVWDCRVE